MCLMLWKMSEMCDAIPATPTDFALAVVEFLVKYYGCAWRLRRSIPRLMGIYRVGAFVGMSMFGPRPSAPDLASGCATPAQPVADARPTSSRNIKA